MAPSCRRAVVLVWVSLSPTPPSPTLEGTGRLLVCDHLQTGCWNRCVWCQAATCSCFSRVDAGHGWIVQPASVGILKPKCSRAAPPPQPRPAGMSFPAPPRPASTWLSSFSPYTGGGSHVQRAHLSRARTHPRARARLVRVLSCTSVCLLRPNVLQICTLKIIGLFACYSTLRDLKNIYSGYKFFTQVQALQRFSLVCGLSLKSIF